MANWTVVSVTHSTTRLSLCLSRLDYCNTALASLPASTLAPFQTVLHAAARLVLGLGYAITFRGPWGSCSGFWSLNEWLPVQAIGLLVHKSFQVMRQSTSPTCCSPPPMFRSRLGCAPPQMVKCFKKVSTFILSVTLSNLNRFSHFLHCWKAYEIYACCYIILENWKFKFLATCHQLCLCPATF